MKLSCNSCFVVGEGVDPQAPKIKLEPLLQWMGETDRVLSPLQGYSWTKFTLSVLSYSTERLGCDQPFKEETTSRRGPTAQVPSFLGLTT